MSGCGDSLNTGWKKQGRTSPEASITVDHPGPRCTRGADVFGLTKLSTKVLNDAPQLCPETPYLQIQSPSVARSPINRSHF